jgi:transposase
MPRRTSIRGDLSDEELEQRYRAAGDPVARSQWQIVWLLALGEPSERVAAVTGYSLTWIRTVARRYNADGAAGIGDRRHANRGGPRLLTPEQEAALDQALEGAAPGGGRWTAAKVADWMSQQLGRPVGAATGWRVLRRLDWRRYRPRPQHAKADTAAQAAFRQTTSASRER